MTIQQYVIAVFSLEFESNILGEVDKSELVRRGRFVFACLVVNNNIVTKRQRRHELLEVHFILRAWLFLDYSIQFRVDKVDVWPLRQSFALRQAVLLVSSREFAELHDVRS